VHTVDLVVCLLIVLVVLVTATRRFNVSYPIVLVLGGLILCLFPRLPKVRLEPDVVFLVFLPPLLYWDALNSSWRDFRENWRLICRLATGLVFVTTLTVMVVAHVLLGLPWGPAFVLGAVLGPTDTVAAATILDRFKVPSDLLVVVRGESLLNDALALVLYETALHVTESKSFVWGSISLGFGVAALGGILVGLVVSRLMLRLRNLVSDPVTGNTIALLTGFAAYLPADALHVSGVLAVVTAGLHPGWTNAPTLSAKTRLQSIAVWEIITFLLNGLLFILIGLQLRTIGESLSPGSWRSIIFGCLLVSGTVLLVRILWVFISTYFLRLFHRLPVRERYPPWKQATLISWVGMRGGISLAAALAIPSTLVDGSPFVGRNEILVFTFAVILVTLVLQGLSLPWLLRRLNFTDEEFERAEEQRARQTMRDVALHYLASIAKGDEIHQRAVKQLQDSYRDRAGDSELVPEGAAERPIAHYINSLVSIEREVIGTQRTALIDLRSRGSIGDDVLRRYALLLDLKESQLEEEERPGTRPKL
jgi:monovalent cation/hydrogen antiporter